MMSDTARESGIELRQVRKRFGRRQVLHDIGFSVGRGEIVGLLGPNGSGKTTTLRIIAGYLGASSGEVRVAGHRVGVDSIAARRRTGYLPERPPLYDSLTVGEYLHFVARVKGIDAGARARAVAEVVAACALEPVYEQAASRLSKGFRQRAGLAQAILGRPDVLLLDEATSGLDPLQTVEARELVRRCGEGRAVLFSSHLMQEVSALCSRVVLLSDGRVLSSDLAVPETVTERRIDVEVEGFSTSEAIAALSSVAGVEAVMLEGERSEAGPLRLRCLCAPDAQDPRAAIAALVVARGRLLRLDLYRPSLEERFMAAIDRARRAAAR